MLKALIIEDEPQAAQKLERMLSKLSVGVEVVGKIASVAEAIAYFSKPQQLDVAFVDIHLSDGEGFEIFENVKSDVPLIFTTAYDQYAIRAFKLNSFDYLLKPVNPKELESAVVKLLRYTKQSEQDALLSLISDFKQQKPVYQKRIMIQSADTIKYIPVAEIAYFFAEGKYIFAVTQEGEQNIVDLTLEHLSTQLDPDLFFRANRKFIVKISAIGKMVVLSKSKIQLDLKPPYPEKVVVSSEKSRSFKDWLNQ